MTDTAMKTIPSFGYEILRDDVLRSILGKHEADVLYWAGKELARKFPLFSLDELPSFFTQAGWGDLFLEKENSDSYIIMLTGDPDMLKFEERNFRLEAGFLAEQVQKLKGCIAECHEEVNTKKQFVKFHVKWDAKDPI
ncbi:MAG: YslB family protein [Lysinibacillus sp.]